MTVIELGDVSSSSRPRPAPEFDARALRWVIAVAVAAVSALTLSGSARPEPRMIRTLWSIPFPPESRYSVSTDSVFSATPATQGRLTAYDITTGRVRWSQRMPEPDAWPDVAEAAGLVLLPGDRVADQFTDPDGTSYLGEYYRETVAIDARTGAPRWRGQGDLYARTDDTALLVDWDQDGSVTRGFRLVRLRDGAVLWTGPALGSVRMTTAGRDPGRPDRLVVVRPDGITDVYGWSDGRLLAHGRIGWRVARPGNGDISDVFADDRNIYVRLGSGTRTSLSAYTLDTVRRLWHLDDAAAVAAAPCGPVVCGFQSDGFAAYDPATGVTRWRAVGVQSASPFGDGRLLLAAEGAQDAYTALDATTGRTALRFGLGDPLVDDRTGTMLLTRPTVTPPMRTSVSRVDLATGSVSLRGTIDRVGDVGCSLSGVHLVCPTDAGRLFVTEVAP
jgi:outer membrane protein assembly factor BamB